MQACIYLNSFLNALVDWIKLNKLTYLTADWIVDVPLTGKILLTSEEKIIFHDLESEYFVLYKILFVGKK